MVAASLGGDDVDIDRSVTRTRGVDARVDCLRAPATRSPLLASSVGAGSPAISSEDGSISVARYRSMAAFGTPSELAVGRPRALRFPVWPAT